MKKATNTSPAEMSKDQVRKDNSMTALERLELAFHISDFALALHRDRETNKEESTSIQWIELHKVSYPQNDDGNLS